MGWKWRGLRASVLLRGRCPWVVGAATRSYGGVRVTGSRAEDRKACGEGAGPREADSWCRPVARTPSSRRGLPARGGRRGLGPNTGQGLADGMTGEPAARHLAAPAGAQQHRAAPVRHSVSERQCLN